MRTDLLRLSVLAACSTLAACATPSATAPAQLTCRAGAYVMSYEPRPVPERNLVAGPVERRAVAFCDNGTQALVTITGTVEVARDGTGRFDTQSSWRFDDGATMNLRSTGGMAPDAEKVTRYDVKGEVTAATGAMAPYAGGQVTMTGRSYTPFNKDYRGDAAFVFVIRRP